MSSSRPDDFSGERLRADQMLRWRNGERILVEAYLRHWPALRERPSDLLALIGSEIDLRRETGEQPSLDEYRHRFPEFHEALGRLFSPDTTLHDDTPPNDSRSPPPLPDVPGYDVLAFVDAGGQGDVFKARHIRLDRIVALKMLRDAASQDTVQRTRFLREGKLAARLDHPHIIRVYDFEEHAGRFCISMEFAENGSLKTRLERHGPLAVPEAAALVLALARALEHAHIQGIIHRDIKPSNVLFMSDGTAKIADFGLAKRMDHQSSEVTRPHAIMGTAGYMAPEQATGKVRQVGPATDVWALGAILYESLTGLPPFEGESWLDTLDQVRFHPPVPPRQRRPGIPAALEAICLKCLNKAIADRYPSARALAADLGHFLANEPLSETTVIAETMPVVPGYEVMQKVGDGPLSTVYLGRQTEGARLVALRLPRGVPPLSPDELARVGNDIVDAAYLANPNIVTLLDYGNVNGLPYLVLSWEERGNLAQAMERPLAWTEAAALVEVLARAAHAAHGRGLVHGNLKPGNILLGRSGGLSIGSLGVPRIEDFAWAKLRCDLLPLASEAPPSDEGYRAPEETPEPRSDVYALGGVLYYLLYHQPPARRASTPSIAVPSGLVRIWERCLEMDPSRRPATALELADELARVQREETGRRPPPIEGRPSGESTIEDRPGGEDWRRAPSA
jgi:serine/threonine protein kinase